MSAVVLDLDNRQYEAGAVRKGDVQFNETVTSFRYSLVCFDMWRIWSIIVLQALCCVHIRLYIALVWHIMITVTLQGS